MAKLQLFLLFLPGVISMGTKFEKCKLLGSELCFKTKIKEIVTQMGPDGTDDDVTLTICPDTDTKQCCTTPALKKLFADDWKTNSTQTWKAKALGNCKDKVFTVKKELLVTLSKSGEKDRLLVDLIDIYTISPDKKITELERFQCKKFDVGGAKLPKETKKCQTGPYHYQQIEKAIFQMDKDGTDDSVTFKIASDSNNVTCSAKLSHTFSDDWRKDKLETWLRTDFGDCRTKLYKITNTPIFSISKNGRDSLKVRSTTFYMKRLDDNQTTKYDCGPFELKGDCKTASLCTQTFTNCKRSTVAKIGGGTTPRTSARRTTRPTTKTTTTTTTASTTKKGLLNKLFG